MLKNFPDGLAAYSVFFACKRTTQRFDAELGLASKRNIAIRVRVWFLSKIGVNGERVFGDDGANEPRRVTGGRAGDE